MRLVFKSIRGLGIIGLVVGILINANSLAAGTTESVSRVSSGPDIVETAVSAGSFQTLVQALEEADLVEALKAEGPYTVFAPNDYAFTRLWQGTIENLMEPENRDRLNELLLYHVVPGKMMSADFRGTVNAETLQGTTVTIVSNRVPDDKVTVNKSTVVQADIESSNGVIHVIDAVLLPLESYSYR